MNEPLRMTEAVEYSGAFRYFTCVCLSLFPLEIKWFVFYFSVLEIFFSVFCADLTDFTSMLSQIFIIPLKIGSFWANISMSTVLIQFSVHFL